MVGNALPDETWLLMASRPLKPIAITLTITALLSSTLVMSEDRPPTHRPVKLSTTMPATVAIGEPLPLKVTLSFDAEDASRTISTEAFSYIVLDEQGKQIPCGRMQLAAAISRRAVPLIQNTFDPKIGVDLWGSRELLQVGERYQLITIVPEFSLADSVWFTAARPKEHEPEPLRPGLPPGPPGLPRV